MQKIKPKPTPSSSSAADRPGACTYTLSPFSSHSSLLTLRFSLIFHPFLTCPHLSITYFSSASNPPIHPLIHPFIHTLCLRTDGNNDDDDDAEIAQAAADQLNSDMDEGHDPDTDGMCVLRIKRIAALGGMELLARLVQHGSPQVRVCIYLVDGLVGWVCGVCW